MSGYLGFTHPPKNLILNSDKKHLRPAYAVFEAGALFFG